MLWKIVAPLLSVSVSPLVPVVKLFAFQADVSGAEAKFSEDIAEGPELAFEKIELEPLLSMMNL